MRILLTGATGFVGNAFLASLGKDEEVVYLGRTKNALDIGRFYKVDITDQNNVCAAAKSIEGNFDAIVHMAAHVPKTSQEDELLQAEAVNIKGLINILNSFNGRFNKLILGSSAEVYDQERISGKINEDSPVNPNSYYGATKLASEFLARTYAKKQNITAIILRFSVMYGPSDPIARALPNFIRGALNNVNITVTGGEAKRDYIHIDDVVRSIHLALSSDMSNVFNIGTGHGVSIYDAAKNIVEISESESQIIVANGPQFADIIIDTSRAEKELGFTAETIFPQKLQEMINSYK